MPLSTNITVPKTWDPLLFRIFNVMFMLAFTVMLCILVWLAKSDSIENRCTQDGTVSCIVFLVFLIGISLLGLLADDPKKPYLLSLFLFMLLVVIIVLIIFVVFAFVVTVKGAGKEYYLGDYSPWIQKGISNWNNIKNKCLLSNGFCSNNNRYVEEIQVTYLFCIEMYTRLTPFNCFINFCVVLELYLAIIHSTTLI